MFGRKLKGLVLAGAMLAASAANALTFNGGEFTVSVDSYSGSTGTFTYTADFTGWTNADFTYIFAVDFGLSDPKIVSIDAFSTTATGGWAAVIGSSSANGCGGGSSVFACAQDDPFTSATGTKTEGVVTWTFTVTFDDALDPSQWLDSDNHIGAFFMQCSTKRGVETCKGGLGLSEETTFGDDDDDDDDTDLPEPGSLALLGLGLLGLGLSRRRKV